MPYDPTDADQAAAVKAAADAAANAIRTETAAKLAELATTHNAALEAVRTEAAAKATALDKANADLAAAQADATSTKAERDALAATVAKAAKAADDAVLATVPEALREFLAGKTGDDLAAAAKKLVASQRPAPGPHTESAESLAPSEAMLAWAKTMGLDAASDPSKIVAAFNKIGPGRKLAPATA